MSDTHGAAQRPRGRGAPGLARVRGRVRASSDGSRPGGRPDALDARRAWSRAAPGQRITAGAVAARAPGCARRASFGCVDLASRDDGLAVVWQRAGATRPRSPRTCAAAAAPWGTRRARRATRARGALARRTARRSPRPASPRWRRSCRQRRRGARRDRAGGGLPGPGTPAGSAAADRRRLGLGDVAADGAGRRGSRRFRHASGSQRRPASTAPGPRFSRASRCHSGGSADLLGRGRRQLVQPGLDRVGCSATAAARPAPRCRTPTARRRHLRRRPPRRRPMRSATPPQRVRPGDRLAAAAARPAARRTPTRTAINDGCDTSNGAEKPIPFKTVNATVVSGDVFIKLPGRRGERGGASRRPRASCRSQGAETIPVGATLDTAHGRVKIRSAADTRAKKLQSGQFFRGRFVVRQVAAQAALQEARHGPAAHRLVVQQGLQGEGVDRRAGARTLEEARAAPVRRRQGLLPHQRAQRGGDRPRHALGVQDRCDGTLVTVQRGRVEVRDKVKRKTIIVRTGHSYLARAPLRPRLRRLRHGWARSSSSRRGPGRRAPRRAQSRTALVLGGGGFTGGVYEIGALRALDLLSVNRIGQPVRHLRRHERRLADRRAGRQRRHARADDADGQRPGAARRSATQPRHAAAAELPRVRRQGRSSCRCTCSASRASLGRSLGSFSRRRPRDRARRRAALRALHRLGRSRSTCAPCCRTRTAPTTSALLAERALPGRDRPRHLRADRARRRGLGRRPDLHRRARLDGAADGLQARTACKRPRAGRRRHRLDHQPRHRGRGGREVHRRRQPAGARTSTTSRRRSRRCSARACAASRTWASRRSATRRSSCSPTSACTRWRATGRSATRASTSS